MTAQHPAPEADVAGMREALAKVEAERDGIRDERNHWIGEAKRYERLYRARDKDATRWWSAKKAAESALADLRNPTEATR